MSEYYASTNGTSGGAGTIGSPWDLATALANGSQTAGDTLWLRGGTYTGKYTSTLNGGSVRSYCYALAGGLVENPSEWAVIDGNYSTTLNGSITSSQTNFNLTSGAGMVAGDEICIDQEIIVIVAITGNNITACLRGASGTVGVEEAHTNGTAVYLGGHQLTVTGDDTTYEGFEITNSHPQRRGLIFPEIARGNNITNSGDGNEFINIITHDGINGVFMGSGSRNSTVYGVLSYNNGFFHPVESEYSGGHNFYMENSAGFSRPYECIALNAFRNGMQLYGRTGAYIGGDMQGCVVSQSSFWGEGRNLIYGPENVQCPTGSVRDSHFYRPPGDGYTINFGFGSGVDVGVFTGNYIIDSDTAFEATVLVNDLTFSGNMFYSTSSGTRYCLTTNTDFADWDNNTYYGLTTQQRFNVVGVGNLNFTNWKSTTGYDANSTANSGALPDTVVVRPNAYEIGRAHIIVHAHSLPTSINVNLATTGLVDGQAYEIRNAFDFFGTAVATGTYDAGSTTISLPLNGAALNVATPVGESTEPATTLPQFGVFVVLPGIADASAPGTPTGLTASLRQSNSTTGSFLVSWTLGAGTETSVTLRRIVGGVTTDIPLDADTTSYTDTGQTVGLSYTYAVKASNAAGDSAWSDTVQKVLTGLTCFGAPPSIG